ncbi:hypothetical protein OROGR_005768 [Orobanche gracilis]
MDPDDTLKRKTFELLYKMTKSSNVEVIVDRMIGYMISISDNHYKTEIASRCVELAEQFAPSNQWFIQTMNKVFEHAGDLVNAKVAHNLMRLIAEGFGDDDDTADSQLRSSAVESYLRIMREPKLPSAFLQVICWVLGEYGTADGKCSASYITGKLCDVAEAHPEDDAVKAYAITALMKIYSFEVAAGRTVDILSECQSLIEEMLASHSTDLQQRAYELQAILNLDTHAVEKIMPVDSTCHDIEIDKSLPFLNGYVQQSLENGAKPYIPESERTGMSSITNFMIREDHESSTHALRFEAYELPKPSLPPNVPPVLAPSSTELVPVPSYATSSVPHVSSDASQSELKLRLDGVQKKWGRPSYNSSPAPSTSTADTAKIQTESTQRDSTSNPLDTKTHEASYSNSRKHQVEISPEKQKLAASLFGGMSRSEARHSKISKPQNHTSSENPRPPVKADVKTSHPPPDLVDLGEPYTASSVPSVDPFYQLEGLLDFTQESAIPVSGDGGVGSTQGSSEFASLFADMSVSDPSHGVGGSTLENSLKQMNKGPNLKEALEKDALVRQLGFAPSGENPICSRTCSTEFFGVVEKKMDVSCESLVRDNLEGP